MTCRPRITIFAAAALALLAGWASPSAPAPRLPLVADADLPLYPVAAWGLNVSGAVVVTVSVDGNGKAIAAVRSPSNRWLSGPTLANVKTWRFQPGMPGTFDVVYTYKISGAPTPYPSNPKVTLDLPLAVMVVAAPYKPAPKTVY